VGLSQKKHDAEETRCLIKRKECYLKKKKENLVTRRAKTGAPTQRFHSKRKSGSKIEATGESKKKEKEGGRGEGSKEICFTFIRGRYLTLKCIWGTGEA